MRHLKYLLLLLLSPIGFAQTTIVPPCTLNFTLNSANLTSANFNNQPAACDKWTVTLYSVGSGSFTLTLQSAPAATTSTPGSFSTYSGTTATGSNPATASSVNTFTNGTVATPWLRLVLAIGSGSPIIYGTLQGSQTVVSKGGGGGGGGATIAGTVNQIHISPSDPCGSGTCTISVPTNPIFLGVVTGGGFKSTESDSGNLFMGGFTSGSVTLAVNDIAGTAIVYVWPSTNGSSGQVLGDSGVTTCPTLPAGYPTLCHQLVWTTGGGGSAGGGVLGFSSTALTLPTAGTTFLAPVGGALASTTEANVTANAPAAAAISNMYVTLSSPPGTGNTIAFTYRDAGSSQTLTCTISGASSTSCQDTTHSFTPVVGDALAIQVVTTGTVVITPAIKIIAEYGVTGSSGGTSVHHQYFTGAAHNGVCTVGVTDTSAAINGTGVTNLCGSNPLGILGAFNANVQGLLITYLPSTWTGALTLTIDASTSSNNTGNFSFTPSFVCLPNGSDMASALSYTTGSTVTTAAPGGSGTGFYREAVALTISGSGCTAGNSIQIRFTRGGSDSYGDAIYIMGVDLAITY